MIDVVIETKLRKDRDGQILVGRASRGSYDEFRLWKNPDGEYYVENKDHRKIHNYGDISRIKAIRRFRAIIDNENKLEQMTRGFSAIAVSEASKNPIQVQVGNPNEPKIGDSLRLRSGKATIKGIVGNNYHVAYADGKEATIDKDLARRMNRAISSPDVFEAGDTKQALVKSPQYSYLGLGTGTDPTIINRGAVTEDRAWKIIDLSPKKTFGLFRRRDTKNYVIDKIENFYPDDDEWSPLAKLNNNLEKDARRKFREYIRSEIPTIGRWEILGKSEVGRAALLRSNDDRNHYEIRKFYDGKIKKNVISSHDGTEKEAMELFSKYLRRREY